MTALALALPSGALTRYEDFDFNSFFTLDGIHYGVNAEGVWRLDGNGPVDALINFGRMDFGAGEQKRLRAAWFATDAKTPMRLHVSSLQGRFTYSARDADPALSMRRADCGLGLCANYYDLSATNSGGADFRLDALAVGVEPLKRRI